MNLLQKKNDDLIDSMLEMCDQMMDVLDEHGGARNKYLKMKDKETSINNKKYDYYRDVADTMSKSASIAASNKAGECYGKARLSSSDASVAAFGDDYDNGSNHDNYSKQVKDIHNREYSTIGKNKFMEKYGGPRSYNKINNRKPGEIKALQDKKRAIKETCLNILSIIDEL